MKVELVEFIADGGFADVWKAKDELGRIVAVKIIREASVDVSSALDHARALAKTDHINVVKVYSIDKVIDPSTQSEVDGVIMEYINGETLEKYLESTTLSIIELKVIGLGIIDGVNHIHEQGLTHGDLHERNIMIDGNTAKVIDILYLNSLSTLTSESKSIKFDRDLVSLRLILQQLIHKSELLENIAKQFNNELEYNASVSQIRQVFFKITNSHNQNTINKTVDDIYKYLMEDDFINSEKYAQAIYEETPNEVIVDLFKKIISDLSYESKHKNYIKLIWKALNSHDKLEISKILSHKIEIELPNGKWTPLLRLIIILGDEGWNGLNSRIKIKSEAIIVKDILAGYTDIHSNRDLSSGFLGTYANELWIYFDDLNTLVNNLISLLRQSWYGQNYVGNFFIQILYPLAIKANREEDIINALKMAIYNDAKKIKQKISLLPENWINELT